MKKILIMVLMSFVIISCGQKDTTNGTIDEVTYKEVEEVTNYVKIDTNQGVIVLELFPDKAPITVENFQQLIEDKHYDGTVFHRVIKDFMIQGGQNLDKEVGQITGEFEKNDIENDIKHTRGVLSMARTNEYNSASDQFFIMHEDAPHLDGAYAAFGTVVAGMDVVDKIATIQTNEMDVPVSEQKINSIRFVEVEMLIETEN